MVSNMEWRFQIFKSSSSIHPIHFLLPTFFGGRKRRVATRYLCSALHKSTLQTNFFLAFFFLLLLNRTQALN